MEIYNCDDWFYSNRHRMGNDVCGNNDSKMKHIAKRIV